MANKQKEEVAKEVIQKENPTKEEPKVLESAPEDKIKVKKKRKIKKLSPEDEVTKVDLSKPKAETPVEDDKQKEEVEEKPTEKEEETPLLEEVSDEEVDEKVEEVAEVAEKEIIESMETGKELPENVQKLVDFMEDTGGDLKDYVELNRDYSELDNDTLLREYYRVTKPHLTPEEVNFVMEDKFSYDEEIDEERDIKRKKLALKEQVADAKAHLEEQKSKYYEDIKMGSKLTGEQQKAIDFFNRYDKQSTENEKVQKKATDHFLNKTNQVFNDKFKGFEYNVGDKKYRFNVKDAGKVKDSQSDINNFVKKFLNKDNMMEDAKGYHKSLFTAMNSDAIANHFYEQGKADALKNSIAKSKNVSMDPRQEHSGEFEAGGLKFKVLGDNSEDYKFKFKKRSK